MLAQQRAFHHLKSQVPPPSPASLLASAGIRTKLAAQVFWQRHGEELRTIRPWYQVGLAAGPEIRGGPDDMSARAPDARARRGAAPAVAGEGAALPHAPRAG